VDEYCLVEEEYHACTSRQWSVVDHIYLSSRANVYHCPLDYVISGGVGGDFESLTWVGDQEERCGIVILRAQRLLLRGVASLSCFAGACELDSLRLQSPTRQG
jgi:hypothetical protein